MTRNYRIADRVFEITTLHEYTHNMCRAYGTDEKSEYSVIITQDDIDNEREQDERERSLEGKEKISFPDSYLETLAVYRKMTALLLDDDVLLFHGSVIAVDDQAFLFTAKSGTGKSTHTANWRNVFGDRAVMVNDDKPLLRITENGVTAYGTPWDGKHHLSTNISVPLKAICVLTRSETNHIEKITPRECYTMLIQQTNRPKDSVLLLKTLKLIDRLSCSTELYRLGCNMDPESAEIAYNGMKG